MPLRLPAVLFKSLSEDLTKMATGQFYFLNKSETGFLKLKLVLASS